MTSLRTMTAAFLALAALAGGPALAANMCQTDHLTCATTMPVDGYCECQTQGATEGGTVVPPGAPHGRVNSSSGGCGTAPGSPGCR